MATIATFAGFNPSAHAITEDLDVSPSQPAPAAVPETPDVLLHPGRLSNMRSTQQAFVQLSRRVGGPCVTVAATVSEVIRKLAASGIGVLLVEQDLSLVHQVASRVTLLAEGRVALDAATDDVDTDIQAALPCSGTPDKPR